jgi:hypothetical protein
MFRRQALNSKPLDVMASRAWLGSPKLHNRTAMHSIAQHIRSHGNDVILYEAIVHMERRSFTAVLQMLRGTSTGLDGARLIATEPLHAHLARPEPEVGR